MLTKFITKINKNFNFNIHLNNLLYIIEQEEEQFIFFMQGKAKIFSYQQLCFFTSCDI
jgi:regulatory protein YycI of two-component signal transduction system YycFG